MGSVKVLVVDDAGIMRIVLKDILSRYCKIEKRMIFEAADGKEAVHQFKAQKPDVVLCDISMPDISGIDVVKNIISIDPYAKIIMCTASSDEDDVRECIRAGAKDYIVKPPKPERVTAALHKLLGDAYSGEFDEDEDDDSDKENPVEEIEKSIRNHEEELQRLKAKLVEAKIAQEEREKAEKEQAEREQAEKEQAEREQAEKERMEEEQAKDSDEETGPDEAEAESEKSE